MQNIRLKVIGGVKAAVKGHHLHLVKAIGGGHFLHVGAGRGGVYKGEEQLVKLNQNLWCMSVHERA